MGEIGSETLSETVKETAKETVNETRGADTHLAILLDRFMRRLHMALRRKAPGFDTERIGPGGALVLLTIEETGTIPLNQLTDCLVRDKSQMTRTVRALEGKGLVARLQCPTDSRVSLIALTEAGRDVVVTHQREIAETIDETIGPLSDAERRVFQAVLERAGDRDRAAAALTAKSRC
ncbi:MAG: MarR family transcriptional regulator [Pseudomonadota bacterium]